MILVTRLNGKQYLLNSELIVTIDETPDTVITLLDGKKVVVKESFEEILERVYEFKRLCRLAPEE